MRRPLRRQNSQISSLPAAVRGMVQSNTVINPGVDTAEYIENWLPTQRGLVPRGGVIRAAFVTDPVLSLFAFDTTGGQKLFAATATDIYDITSFDANTAPAADVTGRTSGLYSVAQMGTAGGEFIIAVNGSDNAQLYDGSSFSDAAITGVATSGLSHVWKYASRLFFVEAGTMDFWYLPVDSIGGAATSFSLSGAFQKGGALLLGGTWSTDSGDGMDDRCVFVSDKGEVVIYQGADPSNASDWQIIGRYDISPPLGKLATMRAGGDFLIGTQEGIVPLSQVISKDPAALSFDAVSRPIQPIWAEEAASGANNLQIVKWDDESIALCYFPGSTRTLSVGLERGAWAVQTGGWTGDCCAVFSGGAYVGRDDGRIYRLNSTGADDGQPFTARYCHSFTDFGSPSQYKRAQLVRFAFFSESEVSFSAEISADYQVLFGATPQTSAESGAATTWNGGATWGGGFVWGGTSGDPFASYTSDWRTVSLSGYALAPTLQITSGGSARLSDELVRIDLAYEIGQVVV